MSYICILLSGVYPNKCLDVKKIFFNVIYFQVLIVLLKGYYQISKNPSTITNAYLFLTINCFIYLIDYCSELYWYWIDPTCLHLKIRV